MNLTQFSRSSRSKPGSTIRRMAYSTRRGYSLIEVMMAVFVFSLMSAGIIASVIQTRRIAQLNVMRTVAYTVAQGYMEQILSMPGATVEQAAEPWNAARPALPTVSINAMNFFDTNITNTTNNTTVNDITNITSNTTTVNNVTTTSLQQADPLWVSGSALGASGTTPTAVNNTTVILNPAVANDVWNVKSVMIDMINNNSHTTAGNTSTTTSSITSIPMTVYLDVNIFRNWQQVNGTWQTPTNPYMLIKIDFQFKSDGYLSPGWINGSIRMVRTDIPGS